MKFQRAFIVALEWVLTQMGKIPPCTGVGRMRIYVVEEGGEIQKAFLAAFEAEAAKLQATRILLGGGSTPSSGPSFDRRVATAALRAINPACAYQPVTTRMALAVLCYSGRRRLHHTERRD
jgi:hypothetical protein